MGCCLRRLCGRCRTPAQREPAIMHAKVAQRMSIPSDGRWRKAVWTTDASRWAMRMARITGRSGRARRSRRSGSARRSRSRAAHDGPDERRGAICFRVSANATYRWSYILTATVHTTPGRAVHRAGPSHRVLTVPIPVSQVSREWPRHGGRTLPGLSMPFGSSSRFMPRMTSMTGPRLARCSTPGFIAPMPCSAEMEPLHRYALVAVRSRWACSKRPGVVTLRWRLPSPKWPKAAVVAPRGCSRDRISSTSS